MNYKNFFQSELVKFKNEGFYRKFLPIKRIKQTFPFSSVEYGNSEPAIAKHKIKIWCTNDYLNMSHNEDVIETMIQTIREVGTGSGGTRNISGTTSYHIDLEKKLASYHSRESAIIFNSAYLANQSALWTICKKIKDIQVFSDELNHASLIQGIKNSGATCKIFKHNNLESLENLLSDHALETPKLIVFESLYSMDGTITDVAKYVELANKYNAMTYLDEVHAVGLYGKNGAGVANKFGVEKDIDIINGTLAKAFGQIGGYIAGDTYLIDFIRSFAPGFIFTTSIMPSVAAASKKSIEIVENSEHLRVNVFDKANYMRNKLDSLEIPYVKGDSHIVPLIVGKAELARFFSKKLIDKFNIYVQPIFYPTVPKNDARLRITITPKHSYEDIDYLISSIDKVWSKDKSPQTHSSYVKDSQASLYV